MVWPGTQRALNKREVSKLALLGTKGLVSTQWASCLSSPGSGHAPRSSTGPLPLPAIAMAVCRRRLQREPEAQGSINCPLPLVSPREAWEWGPRPPDPQLAHGETLGALYLLSPPMKEEWIPEVSKLQLPQGEPALRWAKPKEDLVMQSGWHLVPSCSGGHRTPSRGTGGPNPSRGAFSSLLRALVLEMMRSRPAFIWVFLSVFKSSAGDTACLPQALLTSNQGKTPWRGRRGKGSKSTGGGQLPLWPCLARDNNPTYHPDIRQTASLKTSQHPRPWTQSRL